MIENRYVLSELVPPSILDMDTGDTYPIEDEGIFETICEKWNEFNHEIKAQSTVIEGYQERNERLFNKTQELEERINRQAETIGKQQEQIDNYIDIKAKIEGKIAEYNTKSEEYELSACGCGARKNSYKKQALEELKEELF